MKQSGRTVHVTSGESRVRESEETLDDEAWSRKKVDLQLGSRGLREVIRHHVSRNRQNGPPCYIGVITCINT
jgi:hypothetical protein